MKLLALACVIGCATRSPPPPRVVISGQAHRTEPTRAAVPIWLEHCERRLRRAAGSAMVKGLPGPVLSQRERASDWGATAYDTFINAAATNWALFPDPPVNDNEVTQTDGLVVAVGRSMKFRVALIPIACKPRYSERRPWYDMQATWDPDELAEQANGVSVTIHSDPAAGALATHFVELMQAAVADCLAEWPEHEPERECGPEPG